MREKLVEILESHCEYAGKMDCKDDCTVCLANYLLANGVIVLPCKVGDTVLYIGTECDKWNCDDYGDHCQIGCEKRKTPKIKETTIKQFRLYGNHFDSMTDEITLCGGNNFYFRDIGKTVFLSREEAETALKEARE